MITVTPEDLQVMEEIRKINKESFKRQVIELRALGLSVHAMAERFGISEAAMGQRIRRLGLANQKQAEAVKAGIAKSGKRGTGFRGQSHRAPESAKETHYLKAYTGPCCYPGCQARGYGRRQLCEPHRWAVIDQEMIERWRLESRAEEKIDPWERNYDMVSDSPDVG